MGKNYGGFQILRVIFVTCPQLLSWARLLFGRGQEVIGAGGRQMLPSGPHLRQGRVPLAHQSFTLIELPLPRKERVHLPGPPECPSPPCSPRLPSLLDISYGKRRGVSGKLPSTKSRAAGGAVGRVSPSERPSPGSTPRSSSSPHPAQPAASRSARSQGQVHTSEQHVSVHQ